MAFKEARSTRWPWTGVVLILMLNVRGADAMAADPCHEKTEPLGVELSDGSSPVLKFQGRIHSIGAKKRIPNSGGVFQRQVTLKAADQSQVSFVVVVPGKLPRWLVKGTWLDVHIEQTNAGAHGGRHATLLDKEGKLLYASSNSLDSRWAPGWTIRAASGPGEIDPETSRRLGGIILQWGERSFEISPNCPTRAEIDGVTYLLSGMTSQNAREHGERPVRPDSQAWVSFGIERL